MAKGISEIECKVCGKIKPGNCQATTCQDCLHAGYKWCKQCNTVKPLNEFTFLSTRNVYRPVCKKCHSAHCSNYEVNKRKTDENFRLARNAASANRMWLKYKTDEAWREERKETNRNWAQDKYYQDEEYKLKILANTARRRQLNSDFTPEQWIKALEHFDYSCAYCGTEDNLTIEHIIPIVKGGAGKIYNLIPACARCNGSKGPKDIVEWYTAQYFYSKDKLLKIHAWFISMQNGGENINAGTN